jgi:hypothetical protein
MFKDFRFQALAFVMLGAGLGCLAASGGLSMPPSARAQFAARANTTIANIVSTADTNQASACCSNDKREAFLLAQADVQIAQAAAQKKAFPFGFGVNIHTGPTWKATDIKLIADAGFQWIRCDLFWQFTERSKGVYNFSEYDTLVEGFEKYGIKILWTLDYNNPIYGAANDKIGPTTATQFAAYAAWTTMAVQRFANRGHVWEIWNEPNVAHFWGPAPNVSNYCSLAMAACKSIKAAAPNELIVGPAATYCGSGTRPDQALTFLKSCFDVGLLDRVDAISVHLYRPHGGPPELVFPWMAAYSNLAKSYVVKRPFVSSEWGVSRTEVDERTQAAFIAREFACCAIAGIPLSIWYDFMDDGTNTTNREHMFGLIDTARRPHLAYTAAKVFNGFAANAKHVVRLASAPDDYLVQFDQSTMAWTAGTSHAVKLTVKPAHAVDFLGQPFAIHADGTVTISAMPVYMSSP